MYPKYFLGYSGIMYPIASVMLSPQPLPPELPVMATPLPIPPTVPILVTPMPLPPNVTYELNKQYLLLLKEWAALFSKQIEEILVAMEQQTRD
jgi:hypothetical protein